MPIQTDFKKNYREHQIKSNNKYYLIVCAFTFIIEILLALIYKISPKENYLISSSEHLYYFSFGMLISLVFAIVFCIFRKMPIPLKISHFLFLALLLIWACIFAIFDIRQGRNSYILTHILIITSAGIRLPNRIHITINGMTLSLFLILLNFFKTTEIIYYEKVIHCFIVFLLTSTILVYLNKLHFGHYQMRKTIEYKNKQLYYLAHYDELMKIPNRRMLIQYFEQCLQQNNLNLCCVLVDVDDFKKYNDTYGHPAGDRLLANIAAILKFYAGKYQGMVGRYGGEEFLFIFPNNSKSEIHQIMQEILCAIRTIKDLISISAGGCMRQPESTIESMILNADAALYQVKTSGKDNFLMYTPE